MKCIKLKFVRRHTLTGTSRNIRTKHNIVYNNILEYYGNTLGNIVV